MSIRWIERAIATAAPRYALKRAQANHLLRSYDGAAVGKRRIGFGASGGSANTAIGLDLSTLRNRARHMVRNTPHGHAIVDVTVRHLVGTGITPIWNTGSDALDRRVADLWSQWCNRCDIAEGLDFYGLQALAVRAMVEGGDMLCRFIDIPYRTDPQLPMRLQLMEGDYIDHSRDGYFGGQWSRLGVLLSPYGRHDAYWLYPRDPGDVLPSYVSSLVPSDQLIQLYRPLRIGQCRGVPWLAPVLLPAKDLADLLQSTIVKASIEAAFSGFIVNPNGEATGLPETINTTTGEREMLPEPGTLMELQAGKDIKFAQPVTSTQFEAVALATMHAMAVGAGLTYDQMTGDLRQANYSSLRAGKIEHRRLVEQIQHHIIIPKFCNRIADRFIDRAIMAGSLRARGDGYRRDWIPPANEPIDPKKDMEGDIAAVRAGRMSPQEFIAQWGQDWRKVMSDTAAFWKAADAAGVQLDIDPRRPLAAIPANPDPNDAALGSAGGK